MSVFLIVAALLGRITEWEHFPHYGGGNGITVSGDIILAATSGGLLFSHYSSTENSLVADSGWTYPGKLSHDRVSHVTFDDSGNMWVSMTGGGIDVFQADGGKTHFNQIDGLPLSLGINQTYADSVVYAATTQGLCIREVSFFETYNTLSTSGGLPADNVTCLSPSDSGLFVGTSAGLVFLPISADPSEVSSWIVQNLDPGSIAALEWQSDTLWAATANGLFRRLPDGVWEKEELFPGSGISSLSWGTGGLAVGCTNSCFVLNQGEWQIQSGNLYGNALTGLLWYNGRLCGVLANTYSDNRLSGMGLALLQDNGSWKRTFPEFGPVSNDLRDCTILSDGSVWTSSNRAGASVLADSKWISVTQFMTVASQSFAICPSGSGVFVSSVGYGIDWLSWQDGTVDSTIHFDSNSGMLNDRVFSAAQGDANTVWFGHRTLFETETSGLGRMSWFPGDSTSVVFAGVTGAEGLPSKEVNAILPTGGRYCWAGTDAGLAYVDGIQQTVRETYNSQDGLPSSLITALSMDRAGILFAGTASGLAYMEDGVFTEVDEIGMSVRALACDNMGSVWISTDNGLKRYFRNTGTLEEYTSFNSPLPDCIIYSITIDTDAGVLWMATDHGFWRGELESGLSGSGSEAVLYPDPFLPGEGAVLGVAGIQDSPVLIKIFDAGGSLVYEYASAGRDDIAWDGLNTNGEPAASGVYFVKLEQSGAEIGLLKFALVR